ncbi:MAG: VWA domain-containing protein [Candidatus Omnitrophica bacterium]|nr:VWA domain-containing protein [Candidatus Omnitrophota bacterium]
MTFEFKNPWFLIAIPLLLPFIIYWVRKQRESVFRFSSCRLLDPRTKTIRTRIVPWMPLIRWVVLMLFIIALAGPRSVKEETIYNTEGIDIVLAIDLSGSMSAEDFKIDGKRQNRLYIVKKVIEEFIAQRKNDRIGLIAFARQAYTVCPLTTDYTWLLKNLERLELGLIADGTAVGSALASSVNRLRLSNAKSKIVVLLTDGENNAGKMNPIEAAQTAQALGIKIYTVGAGTRGYAPVPVRDFFGRTVYQQMLTSIDEKSLTEIANLTNAKYFRATDTESLKKVYEEIDQLEKTEIEEYGYKEYIELFDIFIWWALGLYLTEIILSRTWLRRLP